MVLDVGEPACFACLYYAHSWDKSIDVASDASIDLGWDKAPLERAHIIATQHGGSMEPSNFVLLCTTCHAAAPVIARPEPMFEWMAARESCDKRRTREMFDEFDRCFGSRDAWVAKLSPILQDPKLLQAMMDDQSIGLHLTKITFSTMAYALRNYLESKPA